MNQPMVVSVSQLNQYVKSVLQSDHLLNGLMVRGEISNFTRHYKSGHLYFTLKDDNAAIKGVMFRSYAAQLPFSPENGMAVVVSGSVSLYERDGSYQFYVTDMQPDGIGALHLAFEQLKEKLSQEGLFDQMRKRPLPPYPERIGIVTSEGAAALQDMLNILSRRYPVARVVLVPVQVQGNGAAQTIIEGIRLLNRKNACDVMIVGRGGGSIEDLWAFNNEQLARTIAASAIPIVSAVGHETDFTIADFAADLRAPTPSAAAELVAPNLPDLQYYLLELGRKCEELTVGRIAFFQHRLDTAKSRLLAPDHLLNQYVQKLSFLQDAIWKSTCRKLSDAETGLRHLAELLEARSPVKLLERGYSLTAVEGKTVLSVAQVQVGNQMVTRLTDGEVYSTVSGIKEKKQ